MNRAQTILRIAEMLGLSRVFSGQRLVVGLKITFCMALLMPMQTQAQIANGSFENVSALPSNTGQWNVLAGWDNAQSTVATPDCFHTSGSLGGDLPETPIALLNPFEGLSIAGIAAIHRVESDLDLRREYLVNQLEEPLVVGQRYRLKLYWTNGQRTPTSPSGWATSGLGVAFSSERPAQNQHARLSLTPVFSTSYPQYAEDWQLLSFEFVATQEAMWMTLGVFLADTHLDVEIHAGLEPSMAYYFFDALSISPIEPSPVGPVTVVGKGPDAGVVSGYEGEVPVFVPSAFTPNNDGLNDVFLPVLTDQQALSLEVYDRWGSRIASLSAPDFSWDGRDGLGDLLPAGDYVWQMMLAPGKTRSKTVVQGRVSLVR